MKEDFDAIIIGGGPAGSTVGTLLSQQGLNVCIIERDVFPRFHIGESLLPNCNEILKKIGVWDRLENEGFIKKWGAEFTFGNGKSRVHNIFSEGLIKGLDYTFQVERSKFDKLLLDNAKEKGCCIMQPYNVITANDNGTFWEVTVNELNNISKEKIIKSKWLIDASGRNAFLGKKNKISHDENNNPKRLAVYNHFKNIPKREGKEAGNIIVTRLSDGWFWSIPLDQNKTSIGIVSQIDKGNWTNDKFSIENFFYNEIKKSPYISDLMHKAEPIDKFRSTGDYSYCHQYFAEERSFMVGDAAGFIDPVFSSGVYLALESANLAAEYIFKAYNKRRSATQRECKRYTKQIKNRMNVMNDLVNVFYDNKSFAIYMEPSNRFKLFQAINSLVAGNTKLNFSLWWRFKLFLLICFINRHYTISNPVFK